MKNGLDATLGFYEKALSARIYRQELLAANISNADTPNYKARDLDFSQALRAAQSGEGGNLPLATSNSRHIEPHAQHPLERFAEFRRNTQMGLDGNTVDLDKEQNAFAENAIQYQAGVTFLNGKIKTLLTAIQGG